MSILGMGLPLRIRGVHAIGTCSYSWGQGSILGWRVQGWTTSTILIYLNIFKALFKYTIHESLPESKKKLVRNYLKAAGFYSYDAAADDGENPVMRWIGREVKRFLAEAHIHLPFLLRIAAAPPDHLHEDMGSMLNDEGEFELEVRRMMSSASLTVRLLRKM